MSEEALRYPIIPKPVSLEARSGYFVIDRETPIEAAPNAAWEAEYLQNRLNSATGTALPVTQTAAGSTGFIRLTLESTPASEGYRLDITTEGITIESSTKAGLFYGIQTLLQLCPPEIYAASAAALPINIPCAHIEDSPRFAWRGLMLDVSRHFMPLSFVKKMIDLAAMLKFSRFHLHLVDDQGWRIEIKKYPKLTQVGAFREKTMTGHLDTFWENPTYDDTPHGGYYEQDELRDLVAYAAERHIEIIPEIEMPGHAQAAIAAYPELGNLDHPIGVCTQWGIIEHIFNPSDETIAFLQDVLVEVMDIFPSQFIHIGGDEAVKKEWESSDLAQRRIRELGLKDEHELQSWFIRRMDDFLTSKGRRLVGWDEILEGGLAPNATVMSWRGEEGGIAAATAGHDVVMAPTTYTYLDHYQSRDRSNEPLAQGWYLPLERCYEYNPIPAELPKEAAHHVLGAQGQLWTEYMPTPERVEYMAFPRAVALAEAIWSSPADRDYDEFLSRLRVQLKRLDALGVVYRPL
jgi:hexosaminidase